MKKEIKYKSLSATNFGKISVLCPSCETVGTFDELSGTDYSLGGEFIGICICPKKGCKSIVFLWLDNTQNIIAKFPQTSIKFESNNVPENIKTTLIEAIECHGNQCFRAAAVMTRRTLEEICDDRSAN